MKLVTTKKFRKDYKRCKKRGLDMSLLAKVIDCLLSEDPLEEKHHDHALTGEYIGFRECHIQPDWLLIVSCQYLKYVSTEDVKLTKLGAKF